MRFGDFFNAATGNSPYEYQCRLACGERKSGPEAGCLSHGTACESRLINIPTGLGKTAAVVLAWLWNQFQIQNQKSEIRNPEWPRHLVYCLPMCTLMEQTASQVKTWVANILADRDGALPLDAEAQTN